MPSNFRQLSFPKSFPTREEEVFLKMLLSSDKDFPILWKSWKDSVIFNDIDYATMRLLPIAYLRIQKLGINDELTGRIKGIYRLAWVKNQRLLSVVQQTLEQCQKEKIPTLLLKGIPLVLEVYKNPGARFLGDADILIPPQYGPRVIELMKKSNWHYAKPWAADNNNPVESIFRVIKSSELKNNQSIELDIHWNIFAADHQAGLMDVWQNKELPSILFRDYLWKHATPLNLNGVPTLRLSNEDMLMHIIIHGSEGNQHRALRWVVDATAVITNVPINWDLLLERMRQFGFEVELAVGLNYLAHNLKVNIPESFFQKLSKITLDPNKVKKYYSTSNTPHHQRFAWLGNLPLLWYAYRKFENKKTGLLPYLRRSWGIKNNSEILGFAFKHYKRKMTAAHGELFEETKKDLQNGTYIMVGKAISFLASLLMVTVLGNIIPRETVGSYNYVIAVFSIVSIATLPGMNQALTRAVAKGYAGSMKFMMRKRLFWGLLGSLASIIFGILSLRSGDPVLGYAFLVAAPFVGLTDTFSSFAICYWQGEKRFDQSAVTSAIYYIGIGTLSILTFILSKSLLIIIGGVLLAQTIMGLAVYWRVIKKATGPRDLKSERLGMHLTVMQGFKIFSINFDRVIVWHLFGPAMVAVYSFAITPLLKAYEMLPIGIVSLPHLSSNKFTKKIKRSVLQKTFWLFVLTIPATIILITLTPFIYEIFFPKYPESAHYFQILALCLIFSPLLLLKAALTAFHQTKALYINEVAVPIIKITWMLILGGLLGLNGLAIGIVISAFFDFLIAFTMFVRAKTIEVTTSIA